MLKPKDIETVNILTDNAAFHLGIAKSRHFGRYSYQ